MSDERDPWKGNGWGEGRKGEHEGKEEFGGKVAARKMKSDDEGEERVKVDPEEREAVEEKKGTQTRTVQDEEEEVKGEDECREHSSNGTCDNWRKGGEHKRSIEQRHEEKEKRANEEDDERVRDLEERERGTPRVGWTGYEDEEGKEEEDQETEAERKGRGERRERNGAREDDKCKNHEV